MSPGPTVRSAFRVLLLVIGSVAASAASPAFAAQPDGHVVKVTVTSSRVSLTARETPLADVLAAIGRQSGVKMVLRGDLNTPVTETLVDEPLDDAIQRLSRWHSVVLIYDGAPSEAGDPTLSEVWVTRSSPVDGRTDPDSNPRPAEAAQRHDGRVADAREESAVMGRSPQLTNALKYGWSASRTRIVGALVRERGERAVVDLLREAATRDSDPRIRRGAIQALASMDSPDAVQAVRATLSDPHLGVRAEARMALQRQTRAHAGDR